MLWLETITDFQEGYAPACLEQAFAGREVLLSIGRIGQNPGILDLDSSALRQVTIPPSRSANVVTSHGSVTTNIG